MRPLQRSTRAAWAELRTADGFLAACARARGADEGGDFLSPAKADFEPKEDMSPS